MSLNKELIVYLEESVAEPCDMQLHTDAIVAACAASGVDIVQHDDLSALSATPAIGLEANGTQEQMDQLVERLLKNGYVVEDGGQEFHALDQEGGLR